MSEVKIYTVVSDELSPPVIGESFCTDMVRHSDYAALEQKLTDMAVQLANAESKCRGLAAELHSVKSAHQDAVDTIMNTASKGVVIYTEKPIQMSVSTPIHDAYLAEVRAQGVEMAMEHMQSSGSLTFGDCYISLNEFAAQLRQEAAQ